MKWNNNNKKEQTIRKPISTWSLKIISPSSRTQRWRCAAEEEAQTKQVARLWGNWVDGNSGQRLRCLNKARFTVMFWHAHEWYSRVTFEIKSIEKQKNTTLGLLLLPKTLLLSKRRFIGTTKYEVTRLLRWQMIRNKNVISFGVELNDDDNDDRTWFTFRTWPLSVERVVDNST